MSSDRVMPVHYWDSTLSENGNLDYHAPAYVNGKRVLFLFTHETLDISINQHPRASRFRAAPNVNAPRIQCREEDWKDFIFAPGDPRFLEDYLYSDRPILGFRMITFTGATLLTMSWPHIIFDARLRPTEKYMHADKQIGIRQMIILGLRYIYHMLQDPKSKKSGRTMFVPAIFMQHLKDKARSELKDLGADNQVPFISEGDILTAWWAQQLARAQLKPSNRQVALYNVFGLRGRLGEDLLPPDRVYVGNSFCMIPAFMTARDILMKPLGFVAAAIRKAYMDLSARDQVEALLGLSRKAQDKGTFASFGDPWMHMIICSNWAKADLFNIDLYGALTRCPRGSMIGAGKPSFLQAQYFYKGFAVVSDFIVMGKDVKGNTCLCSYLQERDWVIINKMHEDVVSRGDSQFSLSPWCTIVPIYVGYYYDF
ncbi:hypothetical protein F5B19DRAFT_498395 [Rostrohypoxylon terebratum]|nr:hypothetical protein F5B19DRAFT_498395 [Rostrohypoxylon terebratum]